MKAAVSYPGERVRYADVPEPKVQHAGECLLRVKAAAVKHLDRSVASGAHYSAVAAAARIAGSDGVGLLEDGTRVYAVGTGGMMAELALADRDRLVPLPPGIDDRTAAALPNGVMGSAMALRFRAQLQPGETVLIHGATGFTGMIAVQMARQYGAANIIVTGRNEEALQALTALGATHTVSLRQEAAAVTAQVRQLHETLPIDVVIDYLWGDSAALIFEALAGKGMFTHSTRYVSVGALAGDILPLSAAQLRSVDLQLSGSGLGSWTRRQVGLLFTEMLPEAFSLAAEGRLQVPTETIALPDIEQLWDRALPGGKRLVVLV